MDEEDNEDRIIRERKFKIDFDVQLEGIDIKNESGENTEKKKHGIDEALGDLFDPFQDERDGVSGIIQKDGIIKKAPIKDIVTEISIEGERRINWSIMVTMIFIYSIISIQVGNTFSPYLATIILIFLAGFGFTLGEIWIPNEKMKMLGVTWVIISMKVLYGLIIEFRNWDFISGEVLVLLLIFLVFVNLYFAYRHNHDAIAAQSTLVLLAIGSTTGSVLGEQGVAGMIFISTIIIHSLAIQRKSGNLASLGIAASNLWIGMHAITDGFKIGELVILKLDSSYLRVRGVGTDRIVKPIFISLPFLIILLLFGNQITNNLLLDEYDIFTIFGSILTGYILLRDQNSVSDRVLWIGSILVLIILVLLVPTKSSDLGGDGGVLLLALLSFLHLGTAALAIKRESPALAGVTVLSPWAWIILEKITESRMV